MTTDADTKAILLEFQGGNLSQAQAMKRLGLDWYGDLLTMMGQQIALQPAENKEGRPVAGGLTHCSGYPLDLAP